MIKIPQNISKKIPQNISDKDILERVFKDKDTVSFSKNKMMSFFTSPSIVTCKITDILNHLQKKGLVEIDTTPESKRLVAYKIAPTTYHSSEGAHYVVLDKPDEHGHYPAIKLDSMKSIEHIFITSLTYQILEGKPGNEFEIKAEIQATQQFLERKLKGAIYNP